MPKQEEFNDKQLYIIIKKQTKKNLKNIVTICQGKIKMIKHSEKLQN